MSRLISFAGGFAVCAALFLSTLFVLAQDGALLAKLSPSVIDIAQSVPLTATVGLVVNDEPVTASVPLTIDIALQVSISGIQSVTVGTKSKSALSIVSGEVLVDDLGHSYIVSIDSQDIELTEWSVFIDANDYFSISGVMHQLPDTTPVKNIIATLRAYDSDDNVLDIVDIPNIGFRLSLDEYTRFDASVFADPEEIDHYTVEFQVIAEPAE